MRGREKFDKKNMNRCKVFMMRIAKRMGMMGIGTFLLKLANWGWRRVVEL